MNSKQKGSSFERKICKELSLWITNNNRNDILWRSIGSGSFNTNKKKNNKLNENTQEGDITYIDELGKELIDNIAIECKHYKNVDLYKIFNNTSEIIKWYNKLITETKKNPIVIIKSNNKDTIIATNIIIKNIINPITYIQINNDIFVFKINDLIDIEYNIFIKKLKEMKNEI